MAYKDILSKTIKNSGLSLREISARCSSLGLNITPSYISQLQNGKLPPPSEDVSNILAKVCNIDSTELILEGYMEKAPEIVKHYLIVASEANKQLLELVVPYFHNDEISNNIKEFVDNADRISRLNLSISYLKKLQLKNNIKPINDLYNAVKSKFKENYKHDEYQTIFMEDDSMEPVIFKDSIIKYIPYGNENPVEGDIVIFEIIGEEGIKIRRYYKHINSVLFVADNKNYKMITIDDIDLIIIIGKAISFEQSLITQKVDNE